VRDVYVPSEVEVRTRGKLPLPSGIISVADEEVLPPWSDTPASDASGPPVALRDVFTRHRGVVVLGDPGFGKTTLLRWLAILAAAGEFALASELDVTERLLPIPVSVGRLAEMRSALGGDGVSVVDAMARYFHDRSLGEEDELRPFLERELERGRCLVLLDGLDEVKTEEREAIRSWVEAFGATHNSNRFVATSRRYGYAGLDLSGATAEVVLRPFTDNQVERYVHAFHRTYVRWETGHNPVNSADADRLLEALRASPRLSALARNPFMLSALTLIHRAEGRLPRHRVQAYEIFARALCETWAHARRLVAGATREAAIEYEEEALPILGRLALSMHEQHPTGAAPEEFVREQIALSLAEQRDIDHKEARRAAEEFLRKAAGEVQILLERGAGAWGFLHLTFQEFFVAAGLHAAERFEDVAIQHLFDPRWEEILRLGVGYMALVQKRPRAAQLFVKRVLDHEEPEPRRWITRVLDAQVPLAALLAAEAGDALPAALQKEVGDALATWLKTAPREVAKRYLDELSLTDFAV
jgi:predicted NACHT family NTPase